MEQARPDRTIHCTLSSRPVPSTLSVTTLPPVSTAPPCPALPCPPCLFPLHSHPTLRLQPKKTKKQTKNKRALPQRIQLSSSFPVPSPSHPISCPVRSDRPSVRPLTPFPSFPPPSSSVPFRFLFRSLSALFLFLFSSLLLSSVRCYVMFVVVCIHPGP